MPHPLVLQLRFTRSEFQRALKGVSDEDARRRLEPMERLVQTMDQVDLNAPGMRASPPRWAAREVQKLTTGFNRMLSRIEDERRQAGRAVLRGHRFLVGPGKALREHRADVVQ